MTRWDNLHERYFNYLATLSFDKAKELLVCLFFEENFYFLFCIQEKDGNKMNSDFLQYFQTLIQFERNYHNFGFIGPKGNISAMKREVILFELIFNYSFFF